MGDFQEEGKVTFLNPRHIPLECKRGFVDNKKYTVWRSDKSAHRFSFVVVKILRFYPLILMSERNSSRVLCWLKAPQKSLVVVMLPCFSTPRICMHMCWASTTTITP